MSDKTGKLIKKSAEVVTLDSAKPKGDYADRFNVTKTGVYFRDDNDEQIFICSPLRVIAITRDGHDYNYGRLLEWETTVNKDVRQWAMPMGMLASDGNNLRTELLTGGLTQIKNSQKSKSLLIDYIQSANVNETAICVDKTGWHGDCFVFPSSVIGEQKSERLILQSEHNGSNLYLQSGTLEEWQQEIARYCQDNSRLAFAVSISFAAPLLDIVGMEGGGFNFQGSTSKGKSTALYTAVSVCGGRDYKHSWRTTGNALEGTACQHNDSLLALDEMGEMDAREAGKVAYMIAHGEGKSRGKKTGGTKKPLTWRTLLLSTAELTLSEQMKSGGEKARGGHEVRMCDIEIDTGMHGGFECVYDFKDGRAFSEHLNSATQQYYGTPLKAYLDAIVGKRPEIANTTKALIESFTAKNTPPNASTEAARVANRFGLVAAGGELATRVGITGWQEGEAIKAAATCFRAWLDNRGGAGSLEDRQALEQVTSFFQSYQHSRFEPWGNPGQRIDNRAGYIREENGEVNYFVFPACFDNEICKGLSPKKVKKLLVSRDLLVQQSGKNTHSTTPPGSEKDRFIFIRGRIVNG